MSTPELVTNVNQLRNAVASARREGHRVGIVPTMGALHEGHLSLVRAARAECGYTVVTIFVNPTQFGPNEDYHRYPRTLEEDMAMLASCEADLVFAPPVGEVYRPGHGTWVEPESVAQFLEGQCRPGHFRGVATIVLKLFNMAGADVAYFGQKDFQQALVIRTMVEDLNVPIEVRVCPTVREPDGLAMSSRNAYLSPEARRDALVLPRSLLLAQNLVAQGESSAATIAREMEKLIRSVPITRIDYVALIDPETLQPVSEVCNPTLAALAVVIGTTRLIDNCILEPPAKQPMEA